MPRKVEDLKTFYEKGERAIWLGNNPGCGVLRKEILLEMDWHELGPNHEMSVLFSAFEAECFTDLHLPLLPREDPNAGLLGFIWLLRLSAAAR